MDLEPLLVNINGRPANSRIRRRNSGTFRSIVRNRCFMLFLFGLFVFVGILVIYYNPDTYWFAQRPSYTIGEYSTKRILLKVLKNLIKQSILFLVNIFVGWKIFATGFS